MNKIDEKVYRVFNEEDLKDHDAIAAVIRNADGKYLMLQHKKYNFWTFPIGKVKPDQTKHDALKEEVREECDINVITFRKVGHFSKQYERKDYLITIKTHIFEVNSYTGKGTNAEPDKHSELKWMSVDEIMELDLISDATREYLKILERRKIKEIQAKIIEQFITDIGTLADNSECLDEYIKILKREIKKSLLLKNKKERENE